MRFIIIYSKRIRIDTIEAYEARDTDHYSPFKAEVIVDIGGQEHKFSCHTRDDADALVERIDQEIAEAGGQGCELD
jgi:hypothetical protein